MNAKKTKVLLTGGHLSPLLAVYEKLEKEAECVIVGRKHTFEADVTKSLEYELFKEKKVQFYDLKAGRLQRKFTKHTIPALFRLPKSLVQASHILKKEKPDVVVTFGGYIGLPIALAASLQKIPVVLHEQTQRAGLTSKQIGRIAQKICISYPSSAKYFPDSKVVYTGNPIRKEVAMVQKKIEIEKDNLPLLFITGGSTGAHRINEYIEYLLPQLLSHFSIIHQTGDAREYRDYERLSELKKTLPTKEQKRYAVKKFIMPDEIGWVYKEADIVLSRAGANTVSELMFLSKKALLIPLPYGQNNEQLENAKLYKESGLGSYIEEKDVDLKKLVEELVSLSSKKKQNVATSPKHDSAQEIATIVLKIANNEA